MTNLQQYEIDDSSFVDDLKHSVEHVKLVAQWLKKFGYQVLVKPTRIRDKVENMREFADDGDILLDGKRIEIKQRMLDFDSKTSFKYPTIIVDVCHTWDNANPKPHAYILTNKTNTCCLIVDGSTHPYWHRLKKWDRFKKRYRNFYECPLQHCRFFKMAQ